MSEPVNGASERSECSEAERCGASEWSERCERTNVASDRVALSKRDCHDKKQAQNSVSTPKKVSPTNSRFLMERHVSQPVGDSRDVVDRF